MAWYAFDCASSIAFSERSFSDRAAALAILARAFFALVLAAFLALGLFCMVRTFFQPIGPPGEKLFLELPNDERAQIGTAIAEQGSGDLSMVAGVSQRFLHLEKRLRTARVDFG